MVSLAGLGIDIEHIEDEDIRKAIILLCNLIEELSSDNSKIREENQRLRDENAHLKGEQGKPRIPGRDNKRSADISSESERSLQGKERRKKRSKNLQITRTEVVTVDQTTLPEDAVFKGYEQVVVQDIVITTETIAFQKEVYYSPLLRKTFTGVVPDWYQGAFGPRLKAVIILLKTVCNMTEPKIGALLTSFGITISKSSIDRILLKKKEEFHKEKQAIYEAGLTSTLYQHIDDTGFRMNGKNLHTHVLCNPLYSAYFTTEKKDRLTILDILNSFTPRLFLFNKETFWLCEQMRVAEKYRILLREIPQNVLLREGNLTDLIEGYSIPSVLKTRILEAAAIAAYHADREKPIVQILVADDAPQFKFVTEDLALCWVHDGRHYKKLAPFISGNQDIRETFLSRYWEFYRKLLLYKASPTAEKKELLSQEFDTLFATQTAYHILNDRIAKTKAKKKELLLVLDYPDLPLHNNPAELAARQQVRKRDVSLQTKTKEGTKVQDTFLTIVETAKKLKVNIYEYILDRVKGTYNLPSLADIIRERTANPAFINAP